MKRSAGILLSVSSLPSKYGIGCFSDSAYQFVDFLAESGQSYWQILPLGPTSYGDSPYQSFSTFAGNPYFIDLSVFIKEGWLTEKECEAVDFGDDTKGAVDYQKLYVGRYPLLKLAYQRSRIENDNEFVCFCKENKWLDNYALFMALKDKFDGVSWENWEENIRLRDSETIEKYQRILADDIQFYCFLQYHFYKQWRALKKYANEKGIQIIGDIPIYVAYDSADVWAEPQLFELDEKRNPKAVAGCPPDGFAAEGQLWGNPLYNWDYHKETGYQWWIARLAHCFQLYDVVRIDHFRGFDEYYSIPFGDKNAINGQWKKGPGIGLFQAVEKALGKREVIAEDLGFMTDSVRELVRESGFPNMKVIQFAFDARDSSSRNEHLPHNYTENCVAYTGTHDNQTIVSWYETIREEERKEAREYLCDRYTPEEEMYHSFISVIMRSRAALCIIPMQDYLGLNDSGRMNIPATVGNNWKWRMKEKDLSDDLKKEILKQVIMYGRGILL